MRLPSPTLGPAGPRSATIEPTPGTRKEFAQQRGVEGVRVYPSLYMGVVVGPQTHCRGWRSPTLKPVPYDDSMIFVGLYLVDKHVLRIKQVIDTNL